MRLSKSSSILSVSSSKEAAPSLHFELLRNSSSVG